MHAGIDDILAGQQHQRSASIPLPAWQPAKRADSPLPPLKVVYDGEDEVDQLEEEASSSSTRIGAPLTVGKVASEPHPSGGLYPMHPAVSTTAHHYQDNRPVKQTVRCVRCDKANSDCIAGPRVSCARCRSMHQSCSLVGRSDEGKVEDEISKLAGLNDGPTKKAKKNGHNDKRHGGFTTATIGQPLIPVSFADSSSKNLSVPSNGVLNRDDDLGAPFASPLTSARSRSSSASTLDIPTKQEPGHEHSEDEVDYLHLDSGSAPGAPGAPNQNEAMGGMDPDMHRSLKRQATNTNLREGGLKKQRSSKSNSEYRLISALRKSNQAAKLYAEAVDDLTAYIEDQSRKRKK